MQTVSLLSDSYIKTTGVVIVSLFLAANAFEFVYTNLTKKTYYSFHALLVNSSIALLQQLTDAFNKVIFLYGFYWVQQHYTIQHLLGWRPVEIGFPLTVSGTFPFVHIHWYMLMVWSFILILADFCQYWLHRLSHEVNILWAGHIVHHSMEEYNYSVALRQSFIEGIYTWIFYLPLAFFGIPFPLFIMAYAVSLCWQFLVHTRLVDKLGMLEYVLATPSHHRVHHGRNPKYIDKNYGALFIWWDKLFGTFEPEVEPVDYGITTPLQTHNPLWVNIHHHWNIAGLFRRAKDWNDKWNVIFGKPSFLPRNIKHNTPPGHDISLGASVKTPTIKSIYLFVNLLLLALTSFAVTAHFQEAESSYFFSAGAIVLVISVIINIALLENRKWADYAEIVRLIIISVSGLYLYKMSMYKIVGLITIATATGLLLYTYLIAKEYKERITVL